MFTPKEKHTLRELVESKVTALLASPHYDWASRQDFGKLKHLRAIREKIAVLRTKED